MTTREYSVRIDPHGRTLRVSGDRPVLEAALASGLNLPHSCKSGHCGSCRARLKSGEIRYPGDRRPLGLTEQEAQAGYVLLCQARPASDLVVEARLIARVSEVEIKTLPCRVAGLVALAPDVMQVFLRLPAVESLSFLPGQYLDFLVEDGRRRSFSIASPPHDSELLELHVRKVAGGGFTERLFGHVNTGALLRIEGPLGQFVYREGTTPLVMIAGGTGFAPLKSMLRHILEKGPAREVHLYWGARQPQDVYEEAQVLAWQQRHPGLKFTAVLSEASDPGASHRRLGWVHEEVLRDYPSLAGLEVYTAGPPALIEAIRASFPQHGLSAERLHFDSFDYAPPVGAADSSSGPGASPVSAADSSSGPGASPVSAAESSSGPGASPVSAAGSSSGAGAPPTSPGPRAPGQPPVATDSPTDTPSQPRTPPVKS